ncbi:MAG TPA: FAD binding domain-containing protein, partial [Caldimonas sp.]
MYAFDYQRPSTRDAAKSAAAGADTRYLAGGQSLIQAMRLRLSQSERLVDLGAIAELKQIRAENNGVTIGAMATHASVASNADVIRVVPAIAELAGGIADPMVRNMGTIGGSIANADPAACYPAAVLAFNATIQTDRRTIAADDFFTGLWETALQAGELGDRRCEAPDVGVPRDARVGRHRADRHAVVLGPDLPQVGDAAEVDQ